MIVWVVWFMISSAPTAHHSSVQGIALGFHPSEYRAPTGCDTVVRVTMPPRIAARQAADLLPVQSQGGALG
ncbi:MAG: hypothetical protein EAZ81_11645 [Verrucomicrobia bacterium]|nr:MAG: hypothetical protein EAZ81_11645 [Verrucomicrobiota bacterium]